MPSGASQTKVFGSIKVGAVYQPRPAAYVVIRDHLGKVAVVKSTRGYFLPGGGSLPGKTPEKTIEREVREELARSVHLVRKIGEAVQYFLAEGQHYRMEATFFAADFDGPLSSSGEYQLEWLDPDKLDGAFYHQSHAWAANQH